MSKYICKICGKEFDRVGNAVYCNGPHFRPCPMCGKPVEFHRLSESVKCCSKECTERQADISKQSGKLKQCKECGKSFSPRQATQLYCPGPHNSTCIICGKVFQYTCRPTEKPKTCSKACQEKLRSKTAQERYGVANVSQLDSVKQKISETNRSEAVRQKRTETNLARWGVDNPAKNSEVAQRMSETMSSEKYLRRREQTCLEKYGFKSPMMADVVKDKQRQTNLERYNMTGHPHTREDMQKMMVDGTKVDEYLAFKEDPRQYIQSHFSMTPSIQELEAALGVTNTPIYNILIQKDCRELISSSYSSMEDSVYKFLKEHCPDITIVRCDRTQIKPEELDIYLPDYQIGIECNPISTHNSSFIDPWGGEPKSRNYHRSKSLKSQDAGIFLFHIFGYEWVNKPAVLQSMLLNLIGKSEYRYGARKTYVCEVDDKECKEFLDTNHRQGRCGASLRLGLRLKKTDELVAVMTFGHMRHTMGASSTTDDSVWELSRFCNKLNTNIVGGASKLFTWFKDHYEYSQIISFSDISHTRGNLYSTLGFQIAGEVDPSYTWVDKYDQIFYNRVSCQKSNLRKLLNDPNIDIINKTEVEIMQDHGFAQVYDSGKLKWVYR